jgi:hypothetical protein
MLLRARGSVVEPRIGPHFLEAFRERPFSVQLSPLCTSESEG